MAISWIVDTGSVIISEENDSENTGYISSLYQYSTKLSRLYIILL